MDKELNDLLVAFLVNVDVELNEREFKTVKRYLISYLDGYKTFDAKSFESAVDRNRT